MSVLEVGCAAPRYRYVPVPVSSRADDVFAMADLVGFVLDPWQRDVVEGACGVREDGRWAAFEVGMCVPRQNGKGGILEIVELTSLFTWGDEFIIHSAHEFVTSQRHFDRVWGLVEGTPELLARVARGRPVRSHGQEGIRLSSGGLIEFRTRTKGGGRGFSCDKLFLDEAMFLPEAAMGALFPMMRARRDPQVWYAGSAVDQEVHDEGLVFTRVRNRGVLGEDENLAWFEWSLPFDHPNDVPEEAFHEVESYRVSNPAFGIRITEDHFRKEVAALDRRTVAVELFCVGDWPDPSGSDDRPITTEQWAECEEPGSVLVGPVCFAFDVSPERRTSIAAAGRNQAGAWHVEVLEKLPGTGWLPSRLADLVARHDPAMVVCDNLGPSQSVVRALEQQGVRVTRMDGPEHAQACGLLVDAVAARELRHLGSVDLWNAIRAAGTRPLGDRWLWSRRHSSVDISPLVAVTLALWAAKGQQEDDGELVIW